MIDVDNTECKVAIKNIAFTLQRIMTAKAGPHRLKCGPHTLTSRTTPGCGPGEKKETEHMGLDLNSARDKEEHVQVGDEVFEEDVRIRSEPLQPSVNG